MMKPQYQTNYFLLNLNFKVHLKFFIVQTQVKIRKSKHYTVDTVKFELKSKLVDFSRNGINAILICALDN